MRIALIALLALAAVPAAAGAAPWSAPRAVTESGLAREPAVALGGPDAAAVAYVRHLGGADRVELRRGHGRPPAARPMIVDRDARHGLDSPTLTYAGHDALLVWRRFRDANTRVLELASVTRAGAVERPAGDHRPAERLQPRLRRSRPTDLLAPPGRLHDRDRQPDRRREDAPAGGRRVRVRGRALPDGTLVAAWPSGGAIFAATRAPGASAFGAATGISAPGGFARSPQLALTPDGHARRGLDAVRRHGARPRVGGAARRRRVRGADGRCVPRASRSSRSERSAAARATSSSPSCPHAPTSAAGPLRALRLGPNGLAVEPGADADAAGRADARRVARRRRRRRLRRMGHRRGDEPSRRPRRADRPARSSGRCASVSGSDGAVAAPPAFAMTPRERALIAYATTSGRIRLVTRRAG